MLAGSGALVVPKERNAHSLAPIERYWSIGGVFSNAPTTLTVVWILILKSLNPSGATFSCVRRGSEHVARIAIGLDLDEIPTRICDHELALLGRFPLIGHFRGFDDEIAPG